MLISYHWLKKFISLKQKPQEVAERTTLNLVEVESITKRGEDTIFEVENKGITNRPDCFSQLGFAREVGAYFNLNVNDPLAKIEKQRFTPTKKIPFSLQILEPSLCRRYSSIVLTDVKVKPSPKWLKVGVENCGVRSINNVVDITNYVMLELGQPLHAFDYDKLIGQKIIVRRAKNNEQIKTLDGERRSLNSQILVIADKTKPIGIAGIMGGAEAEITNRTQTIVLESANFDKINNRQAEKILKLRTGASTRFEKGLDINLTLPALKRALELLKNLAGVKIASEIIDLQFKKIKPWKITTSIPWLNKFLGLNLPPSKIINLLKRLNLKGNLKKEKLIVTIPTSRSDLTLPADIAEEIARIHGYNNIPFTPLSGPIVAPLENSSFNLLRKTKIWLFGAGLTELINSPFLGKETLQAFQLKTENHLKLINPLSEQQEYLRRTLIPGLLLISKNNLRFFDQLKFFEAGRIFIPHQDKQPKEIVKLAIVVVNKNSYLYLKGVLEGLMNFWGVNYQIKLLGKNDSFWNGLLSAQIIAHNQLLGKVGKIKKNVLSKLNLDLDFSTLEINFDKITPIANLIKTYHPIPKYPPIIEDLTFEFESPVLYSKVISLIKKTSNLVAKIELVDQFKNKKTFRIYYQHPKRSLTDKEVGKVRKEIVKNLEKEGLKLVGKV